MNTCNRCKGNNTSNFRNCDRCRELGRINSNKRANSPKRKEWRKNYYSTEEQKEKSRLRDRTYYELNKEAKYSKHKEYIGGIKEERASYLSDWRKQNKEKVALYAARRKSKKKENGLNDLTAQQVRDLFISHNFCEYCGRLDNLSLEHIVPISRGGQNTLSNVTIACKGCNSSKCARLLTEWRR